MTSTSTAALVTAFYSSLWNDWDDSGVDAVLTPDFVFRGSLGTETRGPDGWRAYRDRIRSGAPDFHNEVLELVVEGDRAAARLRYTGTHMGELLGHRPTGRAFAYDGAAFFVCRDGRLASAWVLGDLKSLSSQLGSRPTAQPPQPEQPERKERPVLEAVNRATAGHYLWGENCHGWRLVDRADLSVIEERMPPGTTETPHVHTWARQFFYVLSGQARMHTTHTTIDLMPGSGVEIPAGQPHQVQNASDDELVLLVISAPSSRGDRRSTA